MSKCPTDCQNYKPKPPEPELTAGEKWAGTATCPLEGRVRDEPNCVDLDCEQCGPLIAKAYDLGHASVTLMTGEEWDRQRRGFCGAVGATCLGVSCKACRIIRIAAVNNYRELILKGI